jgi:hypothetical protein
MPETVAVLACDEPAGQRLGDALERAGWAVGLWYAAGIGGRAVLPRQGAGERPAALVVDEGVPGVAVLRLLGALGEVPVLTVVRPGQRWRPGAAALSRPFGEEALVRAVERLIASASAARAPASRSGRAGAGLGRAAAAGLTLATLAPAAEGAAWTGPSGIVPIVDQPAVAVSQPASRAALRSAAAEPRPTHRAGAVRAGGRLALRADPSTRHAPLAWMVDGTRLRVLGEVRGDAIRSGDSRWVRVDLNGTIGYAYAGYVEILPAAPATSLLADAVGARA